MTLPPIDLARLREVFIDAVYPVFMPDVEAEPTFLNEEFSHINMTTKPVYLPQTPGVDYGIGDYQAFLCKDGYDSIVEDNARINLLELGSDRVMYLTMTAKECLPPWIHPPFCAPTSCDISGIRHYDFGTGPPSVGVLVTHSYNLQSTAEA